MFIDVDNNKLINKNAVEAVKIEGLSVIFEGKNGSVLGSGQMKNDDKLEDYCEYLRGGYTGRVLGNIESYLEYMKYDLDDMAKELSKIKGCM